MQSIFKKIMFAFGIMNLALLAGCSKSTPSVSTIISDAKQATTITDDLAPTKASGSKKISFEGSPYLNDDGIQMITIPENTSSGNIAEEVLKYLDTYQIPEKNQTVSIKQLTVNVQGTSFKLIGGSGLVSFIDPLHTKITTSGDDLIVTAHPGKIGANSYLLISDKNPENYVVQNPNDRYNSNFFMVSKKNYTLIKITWNSDVYITPFQYKNQTGDLLSVYPQVLPANISLKYIAPESFSGQAYSVFFAELTETSGDNTSFSQELKTANGLDINSELIAQQGYNIASLKELKGNSGVYDFQTTAHKRQAIIVIKGQFLLVIPWIIADFDSTITVRKESFNGEFPYTIAIQGNYPIYTDDFIEQLEDITGSGTIRVSYDGYQYRIPVGQQYSGSITIKSYFGNQKIHPIKLAIDAIHPQTVQQTIIANNSISLLPSTGSFQDVLVQHMNTGAFNVLFTPCYIAKHLDLSKQKSMGLENNLFVCDEMTYPQKVTTKDFTYRKAYRTAVSLPSNFPANQQAFKVQIPLTTGFSESFYFYKSDIGIWSKVDGDNIHVRGLRFADNSPINSGTVQFQTIENLKDTGTILPINGTKTSFSLPKDSNSNIIGKTYLVTLTDANTNNTSLVIIDSNRGSSYYHQQRNPNTKNNDSIPYQINSYLNPQDVVSSNNNLSFRGEEYPIKLYSYSDRGLYKAGDTAYIAGFVRDLRKFDTLDYLKNKTVSLDVIDPQGNNIYSNSGLTLDDFGGFKGSFAIPKSLPLGDLMLNYKLNDNDRVGFSHNIKVEEYQKPTFYLDSSHQTINDQLNLVLSPKYFFGQPLKNYDVNVNRSLAGKDICSYCYWWNQEDYYYNYVFNDSINTGGQFVLYNQTAESLQKSLFPTNLLAQKGYQYSLKANIILKDNNSDETQFFTRYIDFNPGLEIGLNGQPYDYIYTENGKDKRKDYKLEGHIKKGKEQMASLGYEVLYWSYDQDMQQGVDGNSYYINGNKYRSLLSGNIKSDEYFSVDTKFITKPGSYIVRVFAKDKANTIIGEVQKQIEYYEFSNDPDGLLGALPNNYTLTVNIPKKTYEENEEIPVDIAPYQKGARVILTVERGNQILETQEKVLDGSQLKVKVKKGFAPNVVINVMQIIGTDKSNSQRKEPRFLVGYGQAEISTTMHDMKISMKTDKSVYKPNEQVKLTIETKDTKGNPVDARISLGVIDKALLAMYDAKKEPIPYFFNKLGTSIANYTNMKLLYQSLRAFANNGSKGGGGNGGKAMFSMIRDDLEDVAFWRGAIYTTGGKADISFTLPENLTTWVIDAIAISKDTKLGTSQQEFKVSKNLVIEANPPTFVTLGDELQIPVKLIVAPEVYKEGKEVEGTAFLANSKEEMIELGNFKAKGNSKILLNTKIPNTWLDTTTVKLIINGNYGDEKDGVIQTIPLRMEGLKMKDSIGVINNAGEHSFTLPAHLGGTINVSLSQFPTNLINPVVQFLIHYPYGCTEQTMSALLPLDIALKLKETGKFNSELISGDGVEIGDQTMSIPVAFSDGINKILARQRTNGSFLLWDKGPGYTDAEDNKMSVFDYALTASTYAGLLQLKSRAPSPASLELALKQAESFLWKFRTLSQEGFLYYLAQKSLHGGTLTKNEQAELATITPQKFTYGSVLRYIIAVGQNNSGDINTWRALSVVPTNDDTRNSMSIFLNQQTAYALKLKAIARDPGATQEQKMEALQSVIALRQKDGLRSSTQTSVQSLSAIAEISKGWEMKEKVSCTLSLNKKQDTITFTTGMNLNYPFPSNDKKLDQTWKCDSPIMADIAVNYIPASLVDQLGANSHVTQMNYSISNPHAKIGETVDLNASWTTTLPGEQVAVEIFLPSTLKFLQSIGSPLLKGGAEGGGIYPFTLSDYNCSPSHRETKFDRLFLYYDNLPAVTCDISIPALKAYNGTPIIQPMRVYEMYRGKVNGRKVITE